MPITLKQSIEGYRYSLDAYLLADFSYIPSNVKVLDLGAGCGIVSFLLAKIYKKARITAIEIQKSLIELAKQNIENRPPTNMVDIIQGDICKILEYFSPNCFDIVVSNPPYYKLGSGQISHSAERALARHEIIGGLKDFILATKKVLKNKGILYIIYTADRIVELINELALNKIEPKLLRCIHPKCGTNSILILIKAVKAGKPGLKVLSPLYIYRSNNEYTEEMTNIFNRFDS